MTKDLFFFQEPTRPELSISFFFPAYNESENIAEALFEAEQVLRRITYRYELIVIDDGSSDDTKEVVERIQIFNPFVRLIQHTENQGYGAALISGIRAAKYDWVFFTDADLQFKMDELEKLVEYIPLYDVVIGHRAPRRDPFMRLLNAKGWNALNRILFDLRVKDIDCAFKLFRRDLVANLPVESRGAMISAEILIRLSRMGVLFKEVPVTHLPRKRGNPTGAKPAVIVRAFREMMMLYRGSLGKVESPYVQAGKYGAVGLANTAFDVVAYYILTRFTVFFSDHILSAKLLSFSLGTISSFVLNRRFTFGITSQLSMKEFVKFYSTVSVGVAINVFTLYVFTSIFHIYDLLAVALSTIITFVWGFILSKFWVFDKVEKRAEKRPSLRRKVAHHAV